MYVWKPLACDWGSPACRRTAADGVQVILVSVLTCDAFEAHLTGLSDGSKSQLSVWSGWGSLRYFLLYWNSWYLQVILWSHRCKEPSSVIWPFSLSIQHLNHLGKGAWAFSLKFPGEIHCSIWWCLLIFFLTCLQNVSCWGKPKSHCLETGWNHSLMLTLNGDSYFMFIYILSP